MSDKAYKPPHCVKCWVKGRMDNRCWCPSECAPSSLHRSCYPRRKSDETGSDDRRHYPDALAENERLYEEVDELRKDLQSRIDEEVGRGQRASEASGLDNSFINPTKVGVTPKKPNYDKSGND